MAVEKFTKDTLVIIATHNRLSYGFLIKLISDQKDCEKETLGHKIWKSADVVFVTPLEPGQFNKLSENGHFEILKDKLSKRLIPLYSNVVLLVEANYGYPSQDQPVVDLIKSLRAEIISEYIRENKPENLSMIFCSTTTNCLKILEEKFESGSYGSCSFVNRENLKNLMEEVNAQIKHYSKEKPYATVSSTAEILSKIGLNTSDTGSHPSDSPSIDSGPGSVVPK